MRWLAIAGVLWCASARALDLTWTAPEGCLEASEVSARVAALHARYGQADPGAVARAQIEREASGEYTLTLKVQVRGQSLSRVVRSPDCASACETAAWLLAMAGTSEDEAAKSGAAPMPGSTSKPGSGTRVRPRPARVAASVASVAGAAGADAASASPVSSPSPVQPGAAQNSGAQTGAASQAEQSGPTRSEAAAEAIPVREATAAVASRQQPAPSQVDSKSAKPARPQRWGRLALFAGLWSNNLPAPAAMLGARAGLGSGILYGEMRGAFVLPREEQLAAEGQVRVHTQQLGLAGCLQWGTELRLGPCLQLTGQHSVGTTTVGTGARQDDVFWLTMGPSALFGVLLHRALELTVEAGIALPLSERPRFSVQGGRTLASADFLAGFAQIGLGVRWP